MKTSFYITAFLLAVSLLGPTWTFKLIAEEEVQQVEEQSQTPTSPEEFQIWLQDQRVRAVERIMAKIGNPEDSVAQRDAKMAVAQYLVNVTFASMTRRLGFGRNIPASAYVPPPSTTTGPAPPALPVETTPGTPKQPEIIVNIILTGKDAENGEESAVVEVVEQVVAVAADNQPPQIVEEHITFVEQLQTTTDQPTTITASEITTNAPFPSTQANPVVTTTQTAKGVPEDYVQAQDPPIPASEFLLPPSPPSEQSSFPASSQTQPASPPEIAPTVSAIFVYHGGENGTLPVSSPDNATEATTSRPIWQQFLSFNFSALGAIGGSGGAGSGGLPFNLSLSPLRPDGGSRLPFNISLGALTPEGGARLPFNFSLSGLTMRGEGGARLPFNFSISSLTSSGGEGAPRLPFNLSIPVLGGGSEGGARLPFNFSIPTLGGSGEGGARLPFNFSIPTLGSGTGEGAVPPLPFNFSLPLPTLPMPGGSPIPFNFTLPGGVNVTGQISILSANSTNSTGVPAGLPFNLYLPPEGFLNVPTPPPMNDSVRMSQMALMSQVDKLVEGINGNNLTEIVDSTLNIATPSTVGVLVNALLNVVLCNPLDRWNGNCGL